MASEKSVPCEQVYLQSELYSLTCYVLKYQAKLLLLVSVARNLVAMFARKLIKLQATKKKPIDLITLFLCRFSFQEL